MKIAFLLFLLTAAVKGQVASATLSGTISDPSSAVVSGTTITAVQTATGFARTAVSDARGTYVFHQLAPGEYRITAEKAGFNRFEREHLVIELNQKSRYDI